MRSNTQEARDTIDSIQALRAVLETSAQEIRDGVSSMSEDERAVLRERVATSESLKSRLNNLLRYVLAFITKLMLEFDRF